VTAVGVGRAVITFTSDDTSKGTKEAKCTVTVQQAVTAVELNETSGTLYAGRFVQLKASIKPKDAINRKLEWTSSDPAVATVVTGGKVTAHAPGKAVITAASTDGPMAQYTLTVKSAPVALKVSASAEAAAPGQKTQNWQKKVYLNGEALGSTGKVTVEEGNVIRLRWEIWNKEKLPEKESFMEEILITREILSDGLKAKKTVTVYEDDEAFKSQWTLSFEIKP